MVKSFDHQCHAIGCKVSIDPTLLMCKHHWTQLPVALQMEVLLHYRKGQEVDKQPSEPYLRAQMTTVNYVADLEDKPSINIDRRIALLRKCGSLPNI